MYTECNRQRAVDSGIAGGSCIAGAPLTRCADDIAPLIYTVDIAEIGCRIKVGNEYSSGMVFSLGG